MSFKPGFWRKCRIAFRCVRFVVWGVLLLLLLALARLNTAGLPDFLKARLVTALQQRGIQLEFSRMRLHFVHGLECDNVRMGVAEGEGDPVFSAREVRVHIDYPALLHRRWQVDGLTVRQGRFTLSLGPGNSLALTNVQGQLTIQADDTWSLDEFRAGFAGATIHVGGEIAHAPECRNWKMFAAAKAPEHGSVEASLREFADTLRQIHFAGQPAINARLSGDARDVHSFVVRINGAAPGVQTPWFSTRDLEFAVRVLAPTNAPTAADPAWDFWTNLEPFRINWQVRCVDLKSTGLNLEAADCAGEWSAPELAVTNLSAKLGHGALDTAAKLDVGRRQVDFSVKSTFDLHVVGALLSGVARSRLEATSWTAPPRLQVSGSFSVPAWTNAAAAWGESIAATLRLQGDATFTNTDFGGVVPLDSASARFAYADGVWKLPSVKVAEGRTALEAAAEENDGSRDFRCRVGGRLDANLARTYLKGSNAVSSFNLLTFREPADVGLDVTGNLRDLSTLSATGHVALTDFAIRGQGIDRVEATLSYTNLVADFYRPELERSEGAEKFMAAKATLDLAGQKLLLHEGRGHVRPRAVAKAIGPQTAAAMEPYQFLTIPEATVEGCIPLKFQDGDLVTDDADLRFNVSGTIPFRWRKFETPAIGGTIHWLGHNLILTNVVAECYGGTARGWGVFDVETPGEGTDFSFFMDGTNVDFNAMGKALWSPTNQLRGALSGQLAVTSANSSDWRTWNGYGQAQLQNGLLWDAPVFGLMSPVLNTIVPGLDIGNSRATEGAGQFTLTNGVIYTDSLEIRSLTMRMDYVGTVDLQENITARVKAQLLRNTPMVGSLFSLVLSPVSKALECEVTGTLDAPKIKPLYIPFSQVLTAPLHPIRTVERIFALPPTNGPAAR